MANLDMGAMFGNLFNFKGLLGDVLNYALLGIIVMIIIAGVYLYMNKNKGKTKRYKQVGWWEEVNGNLIPLNIDLVEEITIPGTNLKVFYNKAKDLWLPRFTRGITSDLFYVAITPDKELVNFTLKSLSKDLQEAGLDYDHTDMRWAAENTKEFIKRNFRDKSTKWWKEYKEIIAISAMIVLMTASFLVIIWMMKSWTSDLGSISTQIAGYVDKLNMCSNPGSGIAPA